MSTYAQVAARILARPEYQHLIQHTRPGQFGCSTCGHIAESLLWLGGKCPACGTHKRNGYMDGDAIRTSSRVA